jgi:hypothetical protein
MQDVLLAAVSTGFLAVRLIKGGWTRQPHYVACAILGALAAALVLHHLSPEDDGGFIAGALAGLAGAWAGMAAFDLLLGREA